MDRKQPRPSLPPQTHEERPVPRVRVRDLLGEHDELVITHGHREYRLRITQNGKLILTA